MNDDRPTDNIADLSKTLKEALSRLTTAESKIDAQSEEILTLKAKNEDLEKHIEDLGDFKEDYNKLKDDHGQLKEHYAYEISFLTDRIEKLESDLPSPSTSPPPSTLINIPNPIATPPTAIHPTPPSIPSISSPPTSLGFP